jgi:hypothetical protein
VDDFRKPDEYVIFELFVGVSYRQYFQLFGMGNTCRKIGGQAITWPPATPMPRRSENVLAYLEREEDCIANFNDLLAKSNLQPV